MALIHYKVDRDGSGNVTVVGTIQRIDPGDEIVMVTDTPNTALQWNDDSPFAAPAAGKVYVLPRTNAAPQPLQVTRSTDMSQAVAQCGEGDIENNFTPWSQGRGFPTVTGTN